MFPLSDGLIDDTAKGYLFVPLRFRRCLQKHVKSLALVSLLVFSVMSLVSIVSPKTAFASTGINQELSFEGKIVSSTGTNITDGNYNTEFVIYTGCTNEPTSSAGCTAVWTEDYLTSNTTYASTLPVTFTSGTFQVNLGSICSFSGGSCEGNTNSTVNWDTYPLYVSINVGTTAVCAAGFLSCGGGTGAMNPYILLTSSPYAMNANELGGISSSGYVQLSPGTQQTGNINVSGSITSGAVNGVDIGSTIQPSSAGGLTVSSNGANAVLVDTGGSAALSLGTSHANAVNIGSSGITTTNYGAYTSNGLISGQAGLSVTGESSLTAASAAGTALSISSVTSPTVDTSTISAQSVTTAHVNALDINYSGGNAAVESSAFRVDYAPGTASGGTWNGMHIVANAQGANSGVTENGIELDGPTTDNGGTNEAINVGTGWDIGLDINSGGMQLADMTSDPSAPASGELKVYAESVDGRSMLKEEGPSGVAYVAQPSLFQQNVVLITGGNGTSATTYTTVGSNVTAAGTLATGSGSTSQALGNTSRIATGTTADTAAGFYTKNVYYLGSTTNGANGFFYFARMNLNAQTLTNYTSSSAGTNIYMGMCSATFTTCDASDNPTSQSAAGFMQSGTLGDTDWEFETCNASACNQIDTGVPITNSDTYDFYDYCPPQGSTVYWRIDDLTTGAAPVTGSSSTDLPVGSTAMNAGMTIYNLSAANRYLYFQRMYFETDR